MGQKNLNLSKNSKNKLNIIHLIGDFCHEPGDEQYGTNISWQTINLFVKSKNENTNSPIHEFKPVLHKARRVF
jgi:hypothetical protein